MYYRDCECIGNFDEYGNGDGTVITQDKLVKRGHFKNGKLYGKGSMQHMNKDVSGEFFDDKLVSGHFDQYGTGTGTMLSLDEQWDGDFICGVLVRGVMRNKYE